MDILRENIGLLQLPYEDEYYYKDEDNINEGFLGFGKKKSRWQRFKDVISRNKGKIAAGVGMIGAGAWTGRSKYNYGKAIENINQTAKKNGWSWDPKEKVYWRYMNDNKSKVKMIRPEKWSIFKGYGDQKLKGDIYEAEK